MLNNQNNISVKEHGVRATQEPIFFNLSSVTHTLENNYNKLEGNPILLYRTGEAGMSFKKTFLTRL